MSQARSQTLFALVESFFTNYLPRQRGASPHTIRAYLDTLKLLLQSATDAAPPGPSAGQRPQGTARTNVAANG